MNLIDGECPRPKCEQEHRQGRQKMIDDQDTAGVTSLVPVVKSWGLGYDLEIDPQGLGSLRTVANEVILADYEHVELFK